MANQEPTRKEENKVIMSKLPRDEFANFKKLCDQEGKTINKKLRELINQHINENFGLAVETKGQPKRFFIPAENRFVDMFEVNE